MQIREQYDFFDDETSLEHDDDLPMEGETENKLKDIKKIMKNLFLKQLLKLRKKQDRPIKNFLKQNQKLIRLTLKQQKIRK